MTVGDIAGRHERGGIVLDDQRRAGDAVVGEQLCRAGSAASPAPCRRRTPCAGVEHGIGRVLAPALGELRQLQRVDLDGRHDAQRDDLAGLVAEGVAIDLLVRLVEILGDRLPPTALPRRPSGIVGAQLETLADIAAFGDLAEAARARRECRRRRAAGWRARSIRRAPHWPWRTRPCRPCRGRAASNACIHTADRSPAGRSPR